MTARTARTGRREIRGKSAGLTLLVILVLLAGLIIFISVSNHANAVHQQNIANCVVATGYSWAHCARITP